LQVFATHYKSVQADKLRPDTDQGYVK